MICIADFEKKTVMVTRVGGNQTRGSNFQIVGAKETVEIRDGQTFSVMGQGDFLLVRFENDEKDTRKIHFNGRNYLEDSLSLKIAREKHSKRMVEILNSQN